MRSVEEARSRKPTSSITAALAFVASITGLRMKVNIIYERKRA